MANFFTSQVITNQKLNYKFRLIRFKVTDSAFQFRAGQYVVVKVNPTTFRSYSIASLPEELPFWEIFVDITPGGPGTNYLNSLKPGDTIETTKPVGNFTLKELTDSTIFGATGCGIAAIKPLILDLFNQNYTGQIKLFWGLRMTEDIVWQDIFENWSKKFPNFHYQICLSQPKDNWAGKKGHLNNYLVEYCHSLLDNQAVAYLCGNSTMIEEVVGSLKENGFANEQIIFESFDLKKSS